MNLLNANHPDLSLPPSNDMFTLPTVFYIQKIKIKYTVLMCTMYIVHTANDKINKRTQKDNHARERAVQYLKLNKINVLSSVSDPYHFDSLPG